MQPADVAVVDAAAPTTSVVGIERAEQLLRVVRADRWAPLVAGILGPGGCGKSALMSELRAEYEAAGVRVVGTRDMLEGGPAPATAVLIDDAHLLEADVLQAVVDAIGRPGARVVVALRPWPRPPALTRLASLIRRHGPLTVLRHLSREEIGRRTGAVLGGEPAPALIDLLAEQTGGLPLILDEALASLQEIGVDGGGWEQRIAFDVIDRLRFVVDDLDSTDRVLLHAIAAGASVETGVLAALLGLDQGAVREAVERVRASGFLLRDGRLIPLFRTALLGAEPVEGTRDLQVRLLDIHAGLGHDVVPVARALAGSGIRNHSAAAVLVAAADLRLTADPAVAAALYSDAVRAGWPAGDLAVRRAEAAVSMGHFDEAIRLADPVLADTDSPHLAGAIDITAAVLAHRGQLGRAAELYRWLGTERVGPAAPMAALVLLATGEPGEAKTFLEAADSRQRPTMVAGAMALIAEGVQLSLTDAYTAALSALSRATALVDSVGGTCLLLDSPAALTGLVAIHLGEFDLAESVLRRALRQQLGGTIARPRQLLLLAWTAMLRGRDTDAKRLLAEATTPGCPVEPRDEVFATALAVGLARRAGDMLELARTWQAAREAILCRPIDLFVLLPLGEFVIAAAVLGNSHLLDTNVKQAWALLADLAEPDLWASPLRWSCVQAQVISNSVQGVELLSRELDQVSPHNGYGRALASASRSWSDILAGVANADGVRVAAAGLLGFGLHKEAGMMLTEAAARCVDRRGTDFRHVMNDLGIIAEPAGPPAGSAGFSGPGGEPVTGRIGGPSDRRRTLPAPTPEAVALPVQPVATRAGAVLSGREVQVARLLLRNQTYREIGERLFISPKTVEHHVARMKQRIGASRRSELFAELRVLTESWDGA